MRINICIAHGSVIRLCSMEGIRSAEEGDNASGKNQYPPPPVEPLDSDCCGNGCSTCVFSLYDLEVERWKRKCDAIDGNLGCVDDAVSDVLSVYDYKLFRICKIDSLGPNIKLFTFEIPRKQMLPIECGQHIVAKSHNKDGKVVIRPYTPINSRKDRGYFKIACKLYEEGEMSCCMKKWGVDSEIEWRGPFGNFLYKANTYKMLLLLAGGTGVTPMIQLIREVLQNEDDYTRLQLVYSVQSSADIILRDALAEWNSYWNCNIYYCFTASNSMEKMKYGENVCHGRINATFLKSIVPELPVESRVLICGSNSFNDDMSKLVMGAYGVTENGIFCFT